MSSWSPDIVRETSVHISTVPVISTELCSKNCASEKGVGENVDERKMRDVRDVETPLDRIMLPSTTKAAIVAEEDMLAAAISSAKIFVDDKPGKMENLNLDDEEARRRFLHQPWSFLRDYLERSKSDCDTGIEECGAKTKEQKKFAVLPHAKYPVYGFCPSRDSFVVVTCKLCGMAVKPVAHRAHMHMRHNIGMKSPEPATPVASVISPLFPSTSSTTVDAPKLCSNEETIPTAQDALEAELVQKRIPKELRKTPAITKASVTDPAASLSTDSVPAPADNYVVVAPHSADRPLKLTFRRARSNANLGLPCSTAVASSCGPVRDRKKPPIATVKPVPMTNASGVVKSRLRPANNGSRLAASPEKLQSCQDQQQKPMVQTIPPVPATIPPMAPSEEKPTDIWNHKIIPSTSSATVVDSAKEETTTTPSIIKPSLAVAPIPATVIAFTPPIIVNASTFQQPVYEHPKPLAVSRFDEKLQAQIDSPPQSALNTDYGDHACYFVSSSYNYNQRRWPVDRRSTQAIRQACRKVFIGEDSDDCMRVCRQNSSTIVWANGSRERPNAVEADMTNKWMLNNGGQKRRVFNRDQRSSPQVAILRQTGTSNRMVRVTSAVGNGNTEYHYSTAPVATSGGKFTAAPSVASTIPNKSYTKVSINQLKAAAIETGAPQVALDLGSLMVNGESAIQYKPIQTTVVSAPMKPMVNQKRTGMKRPSTSHVMPSALMTALGSEQQTGAKKPRMQQMFRNNGRALIEVEEISSAGMGAPIISNVGYKPPMAPSMNQIQARQQLAKALHHAQNPNGTNRRKAPASQAMRHQLTPIVISPSHTPQAASPLQQQPQQQQVVLVSVNGPTVLTGWHKLPSSGGGEQQHQQQQIQTGIVQNGFVTSAATALDASTPAGARIIRPKLPATQTAMPVLMAESQQPYRQSPNILAQKLTVPVPNGGVSGGNATKQSAQARFARRSSATVTSLDDALSYPIVQQQPFTQFRPIQPAQQLTFGHGSNMVRSTAVSSTPVIAGPIVLNVATMAKGAPAIAVTPTSTVPVGTPIGQQVPRQSSTPTSNSTNNMAGTVNFLAASNTGYGAVSTAAATPGIYSS